MYGVSSDIDLGPFVGATLNQVGLGPHDLQLHFDRPEPNDGAAHLSIWGRFEVRDPIGDVREVGTPSEIRSRCLPDLLGSVVRSALAEPPSAIALTFETGHVLRVFDDTTQYEAFAIEPGNVIV